MKQLHLSAAALACLFGGAAAAAIPTSVAASLPLKMGLAPGGWHTILTIVAADMRPIPGHAAVRTEAEAAMKAKIGTSFATDDCIGLPPPDRNLILPGIQIAGSCGYDEAAARGGLIHLKAHCGEIANGFRSDIMVAGRYTPTAMQTTLATTTASIGAGVIVDMKVSTRSRHVGACPLTRQR